MIIILFVLIVNLVIVEIILRKYIWKNSFRNILIPSTNKLIGYELRPSFKRYFKNKYKENIYYETNSFGLRNPPISNTKTRKRILVIGDSIVYGFGVNDKETFPRLLEREIKKLEDCEIINAGVGPYSILQIYNAFKSKWSKLQPDLVILAINLSNFIKYSDWYFDEKTGNIKLKYSKYSSFKSNTKGPLHGRFSIMGRFLDKLYIFRYWIKPYLIDSLSEKNLNEDIKIGNSDALNQFIHFYSKKGKLWDERKDYLKRFRDLCSKQNTNFLTVTFPLASQFEEDENGCPQRVIEKYCKRYKILNINLFEYFSVVISNPKAVTKYFFDFIHLTPRGNKLVAKHIANLIIKNKLV